MQQGKIIQSAGGLTVLASVLHFLVDGLCACCLYMMIDGASAVLMVGVVMVYNVLAFLTQPLTGMLADRTSQPQLLLYASVAFLALGVATSVLGQLSAFLCPLLLGLGNSLFHVWGGRRVAVVTGSDIRALGLFVAPGAFGLVVGMLLHSWWLMVAFLLAIAALAVMAGRTTVGEKPAEAWRCSVHLKWLAVMGLMVLVMLRSLLGEAYSAGMSAVGLSMLVIGLVAMLGKMAGGFVARWIGIVWTLVLVVVLLVAISTMLIPRFPLLSPLCALLLINMTMAVTLWLANRVMAGREGLAFGLLAAALMPGYLLAQFGDDGGAMVFWLLLTLVPTVVIELVVLWSLRERRADVLWSSVVVNVLTNVPLHLFVVFVSDSLWAIVAGELTVVLVEMAWYRYFVSGWRHAFAYSFLCNGISCAAGVLLQQIMQLVLNQM